MVTRATLADVAARSGVSKTTAHYVLTGQDQAMRISEDARHRVLRAAGELHYRPNLMARGLRTSITRTIALITDSVATDPYAGQLVYGSLAAASRHGYLLFVCETGAEPELEAKVVEDLLARQVDGFVYATQFSREVEIPDALRTQRAVLLNCHAPGTGLPAVLPDEVRAGADAAQVLLAAGHRSGVWLVGEPAEHVLAARERLIGARGTLARAGVQLDGQVSCPWWPEPSFEAMHALLAGGTRPRALICLNDRVALGAYQALAQHGLRVPEDVSVVSFDDSDLASWLRPALTSVGLPHVALAELAMDLLLAPQPESSPGSPPGSGPGSGPEFRPAPARDRPVAHRVPMPVRVRGSVAGPRQG